MVSSPVASGLDSTSSLHTLTAPLVAVGMAACTVGILVETLSEFQSKAFKQDPNNKGKPFGGGLFSLTTNINYGVYTVWQAAYALTGGGLVWGITTFRFFFYDFAARGVPVMDEYMSQRVILAGQDV